MRKARKMILKWIYAYHLFSIVGTVLLGYEIITGYKPVAIPLRSEKGGLPRTATETSKAIAEGYGRYRIMRIGLFLVIVDIVIHIPKDKKHWQNK